MTTLDASIRIATTADAAAIAELRTLWMGGDDPGLAARIAEWMAFDGTRRTIWLAELGGQAAGIASLFEYRRMPYPDRPDARWGYVVNMFVREELRNRGLGSRLLDLLIATAEQRGYIRLVLSPTVAATPLYLRAGFVWADEAAGDDRLLVRACGQRRRG